MIETKKIRRIITIILSLVIILSSAVPSHAAGITTPYSVLPKETDVDEYVVGINGPNNRILSYRIFSQGGANPLSKKKKDYVAIHGCAVSSLTTVLSAYSKEYGDFTPSKTYKILEKKVFGARKWKANYSKSKARQMPVSLYGITRILHYCKIKAKYVHTFKDGPAVKVIENHLKKGKPVIIEVNNHRQKNGKISKKYDQKWATTKHTIVLLGMTDNGKVIIADSAFRAWSGTKQRVKYATMKSLIHYMIPSKRKSNSLYYESANTNGGYILVK